MRTPFAGILVAVVFCVFCLGSVPDVQAAPKPKKKDLIADRALVIPAADPANQGKPEKPLRPGELNPSGDIKKLVDDFKEAREQYLANKKQADLESKKDSKEVRDALREQNRELLEQLKEQQRQLREEARERAKEMRRELHEDFKRVVDDGVGEGRER